LVAQRLPVVVVLLLVVVMEPSLFGRFVLLDRIAAGGMGEVFTAVPINLWGFNKFFALKRILPSLGASSEFLQRFQDEVRLVLPMNHPNVVQVFEVGRVGMEYYIVMELVEGRDLRQIMSRFYRWRHQIVLPIPAALYIVRELLAGLDYCHQHKDALGKKLGVVHRDVCPPNVLVSYDGSVKLADFGLALSDLKAVKTDPRHLLGHLGYIAPECIKGACTVDHRADIYSAGVLLFELLTGNRFLTTKDLRSILKRMKLRSAVRPSELRAEIPPSVDALVTKAVSINPEKRFTTARQFHDRLQRVLMHIDPVFGARKLAETVMEPVFQPRERRLRLRALVKSTDLQGLVGRQRLAPVPISEVENEPLPKGPPPEDFATQEETQSYPIRWLMERRQRSKSLMRWGSSSSVTPVEVDSSSNAG
jgi:serine/threonine protein kinase